MQPGSANVQAARHAKRQLGGEGGGTFTGGEGRGGHGSRAMRPQSTSWRVVGPKAQTGPAGRVELNYATAGCRVVCACCWARRGCGNSLHLLLPVAPRQPLYHCWFSHQPAQFSVSAYWHPCSCALAACHVLLFGMTHPPLFCPAPAAPSWALSSASFVPPAWHCLLLHPPAPPCPAPPCPACPADLAPA